MVSHGKMLQNIQEQDRCSILDFQSCEQIISLLPN